MVTKLHHQARRNFGLSSEKSGKCMKADVEHRQMPWPMMKYACYDVSGRSIPELTTSLSEEVLRIHGQEYGTGLIAMSPSEDWQPAWRGAQTPATVEDLGTQCAREVLWAFTPVGWDAHSLLRFCWTESAGFGFVFWFILLCAFGVFLFSDMPPSNTYWDELKLIAFLCALIALGVLLLPIVLHAFGELPSCPQPQLDFDLRGAVEIPSLCSANSSTAALQVVGDYLTRLCSDQGGERDLFPCTAQFTVCFRGQHSFRFTPVRDAFVGMCLVDEGFMCFAG